MTTNSEKKSHFKNATVGQKKDTNIKCNSTLYFQIGLILCLLASFALLEAQFKTISYSEPPVTTSADPIIIDHVAPFQLEKKNQDAQAKKPKQKLIDVYKTEPNHTSTIEAKVVLYNVPKSIDQPIDLAVLKKKTEIPKKDDAIYIYDAVQVVPIFPGCEKYDNNEDLEKCMANKISQIIKRKFNTNLGIQYGLKGVQRIFTQFTIDKTGHIKDVKVRSPHQVLDKEAKRVISKFPNMQPGIQGEQPVSVIYTLPIKFSIQD